MRPSRITAEMCVSGRMVADPRLSPDAAYVAFVAAGAQGTALTVVPAGGGAEWVVPCEPPLPRVHRAGGGVFEWSGNDRFVVLGDDGAVRVVGHSGVTSPPVLEQADAIAVSPDGSSIAAVVDDLHRLVWVAASGGEVREVRTAGFVIDPAWSPDGTTLAWHEWDDPHMPWDESRIMIGGVDRAAQTVAGGDGVAVAQPRFSPDGSRLAFLSDESGWLNVWTTDLVRAAPLLGESFEHGGPTWGPGVRTFAWSPDGDAIAFARNERGFGRLCLLELDSGSVRDVGRAVHVGVGWGGDRIVAVRSGARTPPTVVAYDAAGSRTALAGGAPNGYDAEDLPEPDVVEWQSGDGMAVPARLYTPVAAHGGVLLWVHGGPAGQHIVEYDARLAFWFDRGWTVLVPDYRGSSGWGRAHAQALRGGWGALDVADCAGAFAAIGSNGWGDPALVVPIGTSAGGFTVLHLLARAPERCAAGIAISAVTDLVDLASATHRFEAHYTDVLVGQLPACEDLYHQRSPLTYAAQVKGPLLLLHGSADKVVPVGQAVAFADRMRAAGGDVELHIYDGEGHGWRDPATIADELDRSDDFLRRCVLSSRVRA